MLHVRNVEDHESAGAVGKIGALSCDIGATVQHGAERRPALAPGDPLAPAPPARDLDRTGRIGDVDELVDVAVEAGRQGGRVHVAPPGVVVAVRAAAAGTVVAELPRVLGIREIPDQKAFVVADAGIRRRQPFVRDLLERRDHAPVGDLDLQRPGVGGTGNEAQVPRVRDIGHLDDAPPRLPQMRDVEEPACPGVVQSHLEAGPAVEIEVRNRLDVRAPVPARRKLHSLSPFFRAAA